ncbi:MAG: hypothetical protein ACR2NS_16230 [Gemmatimonadaceae bacterium]
MKAQRTSVLWFGFLAGPLAWATQELSSYAFSAYACAPHMTNLDEPALRGLVLLLILIALAAAAVALAGGLVALHEWRGAATSDEGHDEAPHGGDLQHVAHRGGDVATNQRTGRARFMALAGIFFSSLFLFGIVLSAVPLFTLNFCVAR